MDSRSRSVYFRRLAGLSVVAALLTTAFAPAIVASQAPPADSPSFSTRSITKMMTNATPDSLVRTESKAPAATKGTPAQATTSGSFFKSTTGLVVLAVMVVGTGYALRSASKDRIRGSIR